MGDQTTEKLTVYEWGGLESTFNLADGHPRQCLTPGQRHMLESLPQLFLATHNGNELAAKARFEQLFFGRAGQHSVKRLNPPLSQYSGSAAIEIMANYLRLQRKSVTLLHPTFDSLADTLKRHGVHLEPLEEDSLYMLNEQAPPLQTDALYIVCPNNPTGRCVSKKQFANIVAYCKKHGILLIIDFCFRLYGDFWDYDQYQMLQDAGIDFITTEDTGKILPSADVKLGMVLSSRSLHGQLEAISNDFLLSVSPFVFELLSHFLELEPTDKRRILSQDIADSNRQALRNILAVSPLKPVSGDTGMSVEWVQLPEGWRARSFADWLHGHGIQVLPGERFYWHDYQHGERYIRIALLREPNYFHRALQQLKVLSGTYAATMG